MDIDPVAVQIVFPIAAEEKIFPVGLSIGKFSLDVAKLISGPAEILVPGGKIKLFI